MSEEMDGVELARRTKEISECEHEWEIRERRTFNAAARKVTRITKTCRKCGAFMEETIYGW